MISIKARTADYLKDNRDVPPSTTMWMFDQKILDEHTCKKFLLVMDYQRMIKTGKTKTDVKIILSERYCVSYSTAEKYITQILNGSADT